MTIDIQQVARSPEAFRRALRIDAGGTLVPFDPDPWQLADFEAIDPAWRRVAGQDVDVPYRRGYLERGRGHSKTTDLATMSSWALAFSRRPIHGVAAAADRDQARLLRDAVRRLVQANKWLADVIDVQAYRVVNTRTESSLEIVSSDVASSWGLLVDFILVDELTHWQREELWISLLSAAAKKPQTLMLVISNAGMNAGDGWQWNVREACRTDPDWYFVSLSGPRASWISPEALAEQQRLLPDLAYKRLWLNQWTTGEDGALSPEAIERCIVYDGPLSRRNPALEPFFIGCDLGLRRDHSALVVLGVDRSQRCFRLAETHSWKPRPGEQVSVLDVKRTIADCHTRYDLAAFAYDPHQCEFLAEVVRDEMGIPTWRVPFVPAMMDEMARTLLRTFADREIGLYRDADLVRDLLRINIAETVTGFRLKAVRDEHGHCDRAVALALLLPAVRRALRQMVEEEEDAA